MELELKKFFKLSFLTEKFIDLTEKFIDHRNFIDLKIF